MKIPTPRKLPSGSWNIRMRLDGENISITRPTKRECIHIAEDVKSAYHNGRWCKEKKVAELTLDKLMDNYIESRKKVLSPSTIGGYMVIKRNRFKKYMGKKPSQIDNWQKIIDDEVKAGIKSKTIRNAWSLLESSLEYAKLPVPTVALPALIKSTRPWLDADQIKSFVKAMEGNEYEIPALLALHSLRRSEIFGLDWSKIDLKNNLIRVEGSIVSDENSKQVFKETNKTKNSRRTIPIMIPRLKELLEATPKSKRKGKIYTQPQNYLWEEINRICEANDLPLVGVHGLRHSFASLAHHVGLPEQEAMLIGGWEDPGTMHRIYEHISAADKLKAENKIAQFFSTNQNAEKNGIQNADGNS